MSEDPKSKIKKWFIAFGYESVKEQVDTNTNFVLAVKKKEDSKKMAFLVICPKSSDLITVGSTAILAGESINAMNEKVLESLKHHSKKNSLLANLDFNMNVSLDKIELKVSDDLYEDGLSKDRLWDIVKRILGFYEFMNYLYREHGINPIRKQDKDLV
jgi:hypothetical protein